MSGSTDKLPENGSLLDLDGPEAQRWQPGRRATWRFVALAGLALLATGLGLGRLGNALDLRGDGEPARKLWLAHNAADYDIVFVGTSHVQRAVVPDLVDAALAEAGCQGRSLNLGFGGARLTELALMIDRVTQLAPDAIIVTEGSGMNQDRRQQPLQRLNDRQQTVGLAYLPVAQTAADAQEESFSNVLDFAYYAWRRDLGHHLLYQALFVDPLQRDAELRRQLLAERGYRSQALDREDAVTRESFLAALPWLSSPKGVAEAMARLGNLSRQTARPALELVRRIRAGGAVPVLLVLPMRYGYADVAARSALAIDPTIPVIDLGLDRGILPWPNPDYFFDRSHVTERGAAIVSREIGRRLCLLMQIGL